MAASRVASPTRSTRITSGLPVFTLPPISASPARLGTGRLSPVSRDSSAALSPSSTSHRPARFRRA
jgi:hypothetical protein